MKIAAYFLADAATVREGTLNVLSGLINHLRRSDYPAPMDATLVLVAEYPPQSQPTQRQTDFQISLENPEGEVIVSASVPGPLVSVDGPVATYVPLVVDFDGVALEAPGIYELKIDSEDMSGPLSISILAEQVSATSGVDAEARPAIE